MGRRSQHPRSSGTWPRSVLDSHRSVRDVAAKRARPADFRHCLVMSGWSRPGCGATSPSSASSVRMPEVSPDLRIWWS